MLTKNDLKQIQNVVKEEVRSIRSEIATKQDLKSIKSDIAKIRKDIDAIITLFDREYMDLRKRVEKIEEHLGISTQ